MRGTVFASRYRIEGIAGSGATGSIFRARDLESGAEVAIKVLHVEDEGQRRRLAREAGLLASIDHPGIVRHVAHGALPDGEPYLAMEWLDGEDLATMLARGALTVKETVAVALAVAEALVAAHGHGVVHRDLKPQNIFLTATGGVAGVRLVDFGIARLLEHEGATTRTQTGTLLGSPAFMAPEQARDAADADARADLFSLGAVMYACLAGRSPFAGEGVMAILANVLLAPPAPLAELRPDAPPRLVALIDRLLAKTPGERPAGAAAVVDELLAVLPRAELEGALPFPGVAAGVRLAAGTLVGGRYRVARLTDGDAGGEVYEADDERARDRVALRLLRDAGDGAAAELARAAQVAHANVRRIRDVGLHDGAPFVVEDPAGGETLGARLAREGAMRPAEALPLLRQIAAGLDAAHGDPRPSKIWLVPAAGGERALLSALPAARGHDIRAFGDLMGRLVTQPPPAWERVLRRCAAGSYARAGDAVRALTAASRWRRAALAAALALGLASVLAGRAPVPQPVGGPARGPAPTNPEAARHYGEGVASLRDRQPASAVAALRSAVAVEPRFAPAHAALADAYWELGREAEARTEARLVVELGRDGTATEKLVAAARVLETSGESQGAAEIYERLWQEHPDEVEYGLHLGELYWRAADPAGQRRVLRELTRIPGVERDARAQRLQMTVAFEDGQRELAWVLADRLLANQGPGRTSAHVLVALKLKVSMLWTQGRFEEALVNARQAIQLHAEAGDRQGAQWTIYLLARIELDRGRLAAAEALFAGMEVEDGEIRGTGVLRLEGLGRVALARGDVVTAARHFEQQLSAGERVEGKGAARAVALQLLGATALASGDLSAARSHLDEAIRTSRADGWRAEVAWCEGLLAEIDARTGNLAGARARLVEALDIWRERQAPIEQMRVRLALADVALREGRSAEAASEARLAATWFAGLSLGDDRAASMALLGRALVAEGRRDDARAVLAGTITTERPPIRQALAAAAAQAH